MSERDKFEDIGDDEIRIIATDNRRLPIKRIVIVATVAVAVIIALVLALLLAPKSEDSAPAAAITPLEEYVGEGVVRELVMRPERFARIEVDSTHRGFMEIRDTVINDVPLRLHIPHNADMTLHVGKIDTADTTILFAAQAAFIRGDNGGILGAFVLKGEPLAWGLSVRGYCAAIDGKITVGVADNSPLFEEAINRGGYFFRQYPLVDNGRFVANEPKNKALRRAICSCGNEVFMVESLSKESFHDFTQALVDLGVENAVNLAGSEAYGWSVDREGTKHEFGLPNSYNGRRKMFKNTNYIVWRTLAPAADNAPSQE